jgi:hypothetical protein
VHHGQLLEEGFPRDLMAAGAARTFEELFLRRIGEAA